MDTIVVLQPVNRVLQLFGLSVTRFPTFSYIPFHRVIKYYSFLLIAFRFTMFCYISIKYQLFADDDNKMNSILDVSTIISAHLLEISISIEAFVRACQEETFMENFLEINDILMLHFNIEFKNSEQRNPAVYRLVIWLCIIAVDSSLSLVMSYNTQYFPHEIIVTLSFFTTSLTYFQIFTWADLIRYRLRIVNRLINDSEFDHNESRMEDQKTDKTLQISIELNGSNNQVTCYDQIENANANESNSTVDDAHILNKLCVLCDLYNRLWMQTNLLNERFKFSMVLNIGNDFAYLVAQLYFISMCFRNKEPCDLFEADFSTCILNLFHLSMISIAGQNLADEATKVAHAIHRNKVIRSSAKLNSFVGPSPFNCLSFQLQHIFSG